MATAIAMVQNEGVDVTLPLINDADFGFKPDVDNERILFGLKGINSINTELSQMIIQNRPYTSIQDFAKKMLDTKLIKNSQMIQLIKGGCFTELHNKDRKVTMDWFLRNYIHKPCDKLTLSQLSKMKEMKIIPSTLDLPLKMVNFKKYVLHEDGLYEKHIEPNKKIPKKGYHDGYYILDQNSQTFFETHFTENAIVDIQGPFYVISENKFVKEIDTYIQPLKDWFDNPETLNLYNEALYQTVWEQYAKGSVPHWSMQALSYYDNEHELANINEEYYGIVNYNELPEEPEPYDYYTRYINGEPKNIPKYKISRIAGTVLNTDSNKHLVTLLTKYGVVNIKFNRGQYAFYNRRISVRLDKNSDKKTVLEDSWFKRGNLITVCGIRQNDQFRPLIYKDTIYAHTVNLVKNVTDDGFLIIQNERTKINDIEQ